MTLSRRHVLVSVASVAAVAAMPAAAAIAAVEEAPFVPRPKAIIKFTTPVQPSERVDFAHFIRKAFLDGGGTHERFAIEFPNHAWTIACDVMAKTEEIA